MHWKATTVIETAVKNVIRMFLKNHRIDMGGTTCPCCDKHVQEYKRRVSAGMARALMWMRAYAIYTLKDPYAWIDVQGDAPSWLLRTKSFSLMKWWSLIEPHPNKDMEKSGSGIWRITGQGLAYANREATVREWVHLYNDGLVGRSGSPVDIVDALGKKYNHADLMSGEGT